jgi:hypothetical protein
MSQDETTHPPELENVALTVTYLITREFTNPTEFSMHIEKEALRRKIGYMESLLEYCEQKDIDAGSMQGLVSSSLKEKIRAEAEEMNLLKKTSKLPL